MSIEVKLVNNAQNVSIRRKTYDKQAKKLSTENLGQHKLEDVDNIKGLTCEEHDSIKAFATEQSNQIQQAFALNAMQGVFGGVPVVGNGKFTGEIKGSRAVHLNNRKSFNSSTIEEVVHKERMAHLAFEILTNETMAIKSRIAADPELRGFELISEDRAVQYMILGEVLVKLSKIAMGQRYKKLKEDHVDYILDQIDELIEQIPALANLGKRSRGSDGDLRVNRIRRIKEQ